MNLKAEVFGRLRALILLPIGCLLFARASKDRGDVWLIGENQGHCLKDNGFAFYEYCRKTHPKKQIYFLLNKASPFYSSHFLGDDNVVEYGSARHILLYLRAKAFFYTHTYRDVMYRRLFEVFGPRGKLVYLHHGTLGFKKFDDFYHRHRNIMEIFTVGSDMERSILLNQADVDERRVKVTGYARGDLLKQNITPLRRQLLYMPTHRSHLRGKEKSDFINCLNSMFNSPALERLLEHHDLILKVYLHAHMQRTMSVRPLRNARIQLVGLGLESVHDLLHSSILMISDYSSVCWDFLSLQKPVLFYRFDLESYLAARGSYIDLRDESFGEIAYDEAQLILLLEQYLEGARNLRPDVSWSVGRLPSADGVSNCERIYQLVSESLGCPSNL